MEKKNFHDFDYLEPELDSNDCNLILIVVLSILLLSVGVQVGTIWYCNKKIRRVGKTTFLYFPY